MQCTCVADVTCPTCRRYLDIYYAGLRLRSGPPSASHDASLRRQHQREAALSPKQRIARAEMQNAAAKRLEAGRAD